jgi:hypothetical protein
MSRQTRSSGFTLNPTEKCAKSSLYLVFARGSGSHHYLVEDNHWQQDPTGAIWDEIPWAETHGFRTAGLRKGSYRYYNGALFGSLDIAGSVIVRGNHVRDAFNAIRMEVRDLADGEAGNRNVEICDNRLNERLRRGGARLSPLEQTWRYSAWAAGTVRSI